LFNILGLSHLLSALSNISSVTRGRSTLVKSTVQNRKLLDVLISMNFIGSYAVTADVRYYEVFSMSYNGFKFKQISRSSSRVFLSIVALRGRLFFAKPTNWFIIATGNGLFSLQQILLIGVGGELLFSVRVNF